MPENKNWESLHHELDKLAQAINQAITSRKNWETRMEKVAFIRDKAFKSEQIYREHLAEVDMVLKRIQAAGLLANPPGLAEIMRLLDTPEYHEIILPRNGRPPSP